MEILIGIFVVTALLSKAVHEAKLDHEYAKRGDVSPRLKAKYGTKEKAQAKVAKYGFGDHLRDAWRDYWPRRTDALIASRDARAADGGRPRLRDRIAGARRYVSQLGKPKAFSPADRQPPVRPAVDTTPLPLPVPDTTTADTPILEPTDAVDIQPVVDTAEPFDVVFADPTEPATPVAEPTQPAVPAQPNGGTTVTAPTGEVVNYETAIANLEALIADVSMRIDADQAALAASEAMKAALDAVQQGYLAVATAAQTKLDHEAALGLDGTTLGHAGTTVDAMPPNAVDGLYAQAEIVEGEIRNRLVQDELALASLEAELAHITGTYGDAHATVAGNLGGDSRFLDSVGGAGGGTVSAQPTTVTNSASDNAQVGVQTGVVHGDVRV